MSLDVADKLRVYNGVVAAIPVTMTEDRTLAAIQAIPTHAVLGSHPKRWCTSCVQTTRSSPRLRVPISP